MCIIGENGLEQDIGSSWLEAEGPLVGGRRRRVLFSKKQQLSSHTFLFYFPLDIFFPIIHYIFSFHKNDFFLPSTDPAHTDLPESSLGFSTYPSASIAV